MDLARAEADLNHLIERRALQHEEANLEEMAWKASVRRHNARLRQEHRAEWFCYWSSLAHSLRKSAEYYEAKAQALLEDENTNGRGA